jgi:hypothetical protein
MLQEYNLQQQHFTERRTIQATCHSLGDDHRIIRRWFSAGADHFASRAQ